MKHSILARKIYKFLNIVEVKGGLVTQTKLDRNDPMNKGSICPKSIASVQLLYHPDRLKYPMIRDDPRGSGKWKRISWNEALDIISEKLTNIKRESGPEAVVMARGTNRGSWIRLFNRFANSFRTPNWTESGGAQCFTPRSLAQQLTFGGIALEWPDAEASNTVMVWGADPPATWPPKSRKIIEANSHGAKLIVVDPVLSNMTSKADVWLPLRLGTDVAMALVMINVIISEGLYDKDYVNKYCIGFEELAKRASEYTPKKVSEITWVPEEKIIKAARLYATNKPSSIAISATFDEIVDPIQLGRAVSILAAILDIRAIGSRIGYTVLDPSSKWSQNQTDSNPNDSASLAFSIRAETLTALPGTVKLSSAIPNLMNILSQKLLINLTKNKKSGQPYQVVY